MKECRHEIGLATAVDIDLQKQFRVGVDLSVPRAPHPVEKFADALAE